MSWTTSECPLPQVEIHHCDKQGCGGLARVHFLSVHETEPRREAKRCDAHAEEIRSNVEKKRTPLSPPAPTPQSLDQTAAALEPKPPEKPKRPPKIYTLPTDEMPAMCSSCADSIFWIITEAGRRMPIDAFGERAGQSHFISCKHADQHRKPR